MFLTGVVCLRFEILNAQASVDATPDHRRFVEHLGCDGGELFQDEADHRCLMID